VKAGDLFGSLQVVREVKRRGSGMRRFVCRCIRCGEEKPRFMSTLRNGTAGCNRCRSLDVEARMLGTRFGKLVVLKYTPGFMDRGRYVKPIVLCACDCGKISEHLSYNLVSRGTRSCGCSRGEKR
jgi:hypothetical protein